MKAVPIYTTGELAKLCGVTVRTVQYYDSRGILMPHGLSEGGRRLYNDSDVRLLRLICFLRDLDLPIDSIRELLREEHPEHVISLLLEQQQTLLQEELAEKSQKLERLKSLQNELRTVKELTLDDVGDIAVIMENKKKLKALHRNMILAGIPMTLLEIGGILLWILRGIWWPFLLYVLLCVPFGIFISRLYFRSVSYICPECHEVFKPALKEAFFARHTPTARKLSCTHCGHQGFCIEIWGGK